MPPQNPLTLRFRSDGLEAAFYEDYVQRSLRQVRYALLLGVAIYGLVFGAVDLMSVPAQISVTWTIRLVVCLLTLGVFLLTFSSLFERLMQPALSGLLLLGGWGLILMLALDPSGENFYDGPVLIILPAYVIVRLRFVYASCVGWLIVAAYVGVAVWMKGAPTDELVSNIIFITSANLLGMFAGYMLEDYARRQYWQAQVIDEKRRENEELLQARSRFFANVSHEFRTPLTLILGPLDNLLDEQAPPHLPDRLHASLRMMQRNARRLLHLINQILDLARLEAGGLHLHAREAPLTPFLKGILSSFSVLAERKDIDLQFQTEAPDLALYFDRDKLEKVVINLLANALKFTPEGGAVRVAAARADGAAEIRVRDTGPGIPAEDMSSVFDRFRQAGDASLREQDGAGIGLAFTKELIELHHGRIAVESEPGFGSEFIVTLPLGRAHLRDEEIAKGPSPHAGFEGKRLEDLQETPEPSHPPVPLRPSPAEQPDGAPSDAVDTILVVEDHPDVRAYLRDCLTPAYAITEACDGEDGLEKARAVVPDLILTDVMMPGMDGYAFCRALKDDPVLDHIPVVMLTAKAEQDHKIEGLRAGAEAYLSKPFNARELRTHAENLLQNRRRLRKRFSSEVLVQPTPVDVDSADERFIQRARAAVEAHLDDEHFNVDAFAEAMGMSRRQLQRKLRAVADQTPSAFIRLIRLGRAAQLIEQDYGTISEIAYAVGFNTPSYFTKCFREVFDATPSAYAAADR